MPCFTEEQLQELESIYGLIRVNKPEPEVAVIRDGTITRGDMVWWRCEDGPEYINSSIQSHWDNLREYPEAYQIRKPVTMLCYKD